MDIWVQNIKTGESWRLDEDTTKEVYKEPNGGIYYKLGMWSYRFLPVDPNRPAKERRGYQYSIFDYEGQEDGKESNTDNYRAGSK